MTRDDIIRMARESADQSPREDWNTNAWVFGEEALERFFHAAYDAGAAAEREAYFAAKAMEALLTSIESGKEHQAALVPSTAYDIADAMLKEREK